jgi:arylsulfatase A-like enzyme
MDRYLGMMFETLRETGQDKNTVVVFVADHGDGCAAHHWNQKIALWEECTRVPLMIWQPGAIEGGRVVNDPVSTGLDLLPTLCDFAGASLPREYQGSSLKPVCMGDTQRPHDFVVTETDVRSGRGFSICSGRYKYVLYTSGANNELLFDLQEDPGETANRIDDSSLQNELKEHRAALGNWAVETKDELTVPST